MKTCIICRKEKEESDFNDEHVIPDSIGGYYHIKSVCKECNSKLGNKIDILLVEHKSIEIKRSELRIKGKKGHLPNPFNGIWKFDGTDIDVRLKIDKKNILTPEIVTKCEEQSPLNKCYTFDKSNERLIDSIISKNIKRNNISHKQLKYTKEVKSINSPIVGSFTFDLRNYKIALLKIAYEFAVDCVPSYFKDKMAVRISNKK